MKRHTRKSGSNESIEEALELLRQEVAVVRQVLAEILDELQWANRNRDHEDSWRVGRRITSMPVDPTADDWAERINRHCAADLPGDEADAPLAAYSEDWPRL